MVGAKAGRVALQTFIWLFYLRHVLVQCGYRCIYWLAVVFVPPGDGLQCRPFNVAK